MNLLSPPPFGRGLIFSLAVFDACFARNAPVRPSIELQVSQVVPNELQQILCDAIRLNESLT
jgi:hypothetical protein